MGLGIWSMHFIGMLAFDLPIPVGLRPWHHPVLAGGLDRRFGCPVAGVAPSLPWRRLLAGAVLMGLGIAAMHYLGMAAMRMQPGIDYHPGWFAASIAVAIGAAGAALWIAFRLRAEQRNTLLRALASLVMGLAIVGMHYTGMAAARFPKAASVARSAAVASIHAGWPCW